MLIVLAWGRNKDPLRKTVSAVLGAVLPACAANSRLEVLLHASHVETRAVWAAMDHLNCGIVLIDPGGRVLGLNQFAGEILDGQDGLCVNDGFLAASRRTDNLGLHAALRRLSDPTIEAAPISAFTLPKNDGKECLHVIMKWSVDPRSATTPASSFIVVFLCDPARHHIASAGLLSGLFAFTRVEAEVALLLSEGLSVSEVADRLRSSRNTIRTYLKAVFQKTGTRRQAALVRVILMCVGSVRAVPGSEACAPSAPERRRDDARPPHMVSHLRGP